MNEQLGDNPLRDIAQNPNAYAAYLADIQRVLRDITKNASTLHGETSVHCRNTHVEGDGGRDARRRAKPVEKSFTEALKGLEKALQGFEKAAFTRRAHDDRVKVLPGERRQKAIAKAQKKNPPLNSPTESTQQVPPVPNTPPQGYSGATPTQITDLHGWRNVS